MDYLRQITRKRRGTEPPPVIAFHSLSLAQFELLSDWHHYAILSLLEVPDANVDPRWIARRLGISQMQARRSLELLKGLNLIEQRPDGTWRQSTAPLKVENTISTPATRRAHAQLLELARHSLENDPWEARDFSSVTLAIDPALIPHARERIRAFRRELMAELESMSTPQEVYELSVQIFPLSRSQNEPKKE